MISGNKMINVNLFHWKHDISKASEQVRQNVFVTGLVPRALIIKDYRRFCCMALIAASRAEGGPFP